MRRLWRDSVEAKGGWGLSFALHRLAITIEALMADEFQVRTHGANVEVVLRNSTVLRGRMFLHERAEKHPGAEKVEDVLNAPEQFFPLAVREGGEKTLLVNKSQTLYVKVPAEHGRSQARAESAPSWAVQVAIEMVQGAPLQGVVHFAQPPGRDRTLDALNESAPYLCLVQDAAFYYVHLSSVVVVREKGPHFESVAPKAP